MQTELAETAPNRLLPSSTVGGRLAEREGRLEQRIRERPVVAFIVAATAGVLAGRLLRAWLNTRWPREEGDRD